MCDKKGYFPRDHSFSTYAKFSEKLKTNVSYPLIHTYVIYSIFDDLVPLRKNILCIYRIYV